MPASLSPQGSVEMVKQTSKESTDSSDRCDVVLQRGRSDWDFLEARRWEYRSVSPTLPSTPSPHTPSPSPSFTTRAALSQAAVAIARKPKLHSLYSPTHPASCLSFPSHRLPVFSRLASILSPHQSIAPGLCRDSVASSAWVSSLAPCLG